MQPIILSDVHLSLQEFQQLNQQAILRRRWWVFLLPVVYPVYNFWAEIDFSDLSSIIPLVILILIYAVIVVIVLRRQSKRQYTATPLFQQSTTYTLADAGVTVINSLQHSTLAWSVFKGVRRMGRWYILVSENQQGLLLDSARIQLPATEADLLNAFQQRGLRLL
ncbi:hypothetical protein [Hymenobacter weizhouensis]|uniref:hypothetical protein n=1 Tax=Hymenobacter sp. YIM 151500-1 TaxID=2987689 RepID=UPI002225F1AF|nr:hypothetical protein [Hymenobacter sp. YIM 151500-1]UYZ65058.1 hypothetical protein OIS53_09440 [Hymenobacter sp. YIM 151500-1]